MLMLGPAKRATVVSALLKILLNAICTSRISDNIFTIISQPGLTVRWEGLDLEAGGLGLSSRPSLPRVGCKNAQKSSCAHLKMKGIIPTCCAFYVKFHGKEFCEVLHIRGALVSTV